MIRLNRSHAKAAVAAGVSAAVIGSGAVAYAALGTGPTATPSLTAASSGAGKAASLGQLGKLVIGEVTDVSTTRPASGPAAAVGTIKIKTPDGQVVTADLAKRTRVYAYHGPADKPTVEAVTALKDNELVAVRIVARRARTGSSSPSAPAAGTSTSALLTAASTATGTRYAALIVDLGFAA